MDGEWLTYAEAAVRLGVTPEAARRLAIRGRWQRMPGNDGRMCVRLPGPWRVPPVRTDDVLLHALEAHIEALKGENETLKAQLAAPAVSTGKQGAEFAKQAASEQATPRLKPVPCGSSIRSRP